MKKLIDYEQVNTLLGDTIATWWLVYKIGDIYVSNTEIDIEMWNLDYEDKVYYLPFVLNKKLVKLKKCMI